MNRFSFQQQHINCWGSNFHVVKYHNKNFLFLQQKSRISFAMILLHVTWCVTYGICYHMTHHFNRSNCHITYADGTINHMTWPDTLLSHMMGHSVMRRRTGPPNFPDSFSILPLDLLHYQHPLKNPVSTTSRIQNILKYYKIYQSSTFYTLE